MLPAASPRERRANRCFANLTEAIDYFAGRHEVVAAYLFGSVARGEARTGSDIDVGVLLRDGKPGTLEEFDVVFVIQDELERRCA